MFDRYARHRGSTAVRTVVDTERRDVDGETDGTVVVDAPASAAVAVTLEA